MTDKNPPGLIIEPKNKHGITVVRCEGDVTPDIYPFAVADRNEFLELYNRSLPKVKFDFAPADFSGQSLAFTPEEQARLCRKVALHWMYFYYFNKMPVKLGKSDLEHPQTYQIVHRFAGHKLGHDTAQAAALAAKCLGMPIEYFKGWLERDKQLGDAF